MSATTTTIQPRAARQAPRAGPQLPRLPGRSWDAEETRNYAKAERLGNEFTEDFRLLADIGWGEREDRESFELTTPAHDLMELAKRLHDEASRCSSGRHRAVMSAAAAILIRFKMRGCRA